MSLPIVFRFEASDDVDSIRNSLNMVRPGIGDNFVERLSEKLQLIASHPQAFAIVWRNVRASKLKRFQYVIYYRVQTDRIEVLAVVHGNRDSLDWKSRA